MIAQSLKSFSPTSLGQQSNERDLLWRRKGQSHNEQQSGMFQNKLLFNEAIPARASNRATYVAPPAPIVIERLLPLSEHCENVDSTKSSFTFTTLSEERLQAAVKLAKSDLRRRRLKSLTKSAAEPHPQISFFETSDAELLEELVGKPNKAKLKSSSPKEKAVRPRTKVLYTYQKHHISHMPKSGQSPPTRDPGPKQQEKDEHIPLSREICKLQKELEVYIQKVEELASKGGKIEEPLDPEEQNKLELRRQKQAARSARFIYVLQQQVKEIQDDIQKLHRQKTCDNKKTATLNRLAAAHRGTLRALQVVVHQLSDLFHSKVPPHFKELCQVIRQLSLCSAKMEVEHGSAIPESALNILQKLESLDSALSKQETVEKMQVQACPPHRRHPHPGMSPGGAPKGASNLTAGGPGKSSNPRRGSRKVQHKPKTASYHPMNRREVPRTALKGLVQQRELREQQGQPQTKTQCKKGRHFGRTKADDDAKRNHMQDVGFQQPTVSSRLRVNQLPQKEHSVPWMPTSPHSPPPQRSPQRGRSEPRCLFSPVKISLSPPKQIGGVEAELALSSEKKKQSQNEALRKAWLDRMTMQRIKELNQLSMEGTERIQKLRSEIVSPTQWAEKAEQEARDRIQPLLNEAQIIESRNRINPFLKSRLSEQAAERAAESAEQLSEALLEDLLEDTAEVAWAVKTDRQTEDIAQRSLRAPTLESMLLRMNEIQRDQEEVRRRFASITYSDPLYWDQPETAGPQTSTSGTRPASPQPIRLTRPIMKQSCAADIVLKPPVETGLSLLSENSLTEEASQEEQHPSNSAVFPVEAEKSRRTLISVPGSRLKNIRRYREDYEAYLRTVAHEGVGGFNPWAIAESLAEDLLSEAVADVAAEFQEVVEEYAEAVFTSEFVPPVPSATASVSAVVS